MEFFSFSTLKFKIMKNPQKRFHFVYFSFFFRSIIITICIYDRYDPASHILKLTYWKKREEKKNVIMLFRPHNQAV